MSDRSVSHPTSEEPVKVTLTLEPAVFRFFKEKAEKSGVDVDAYLSSTLSIVLGCKAFNKISACSPQATVPKGSSTCSG